MKTSQVLKRMNQVISNLPYLPEVLLPLDSTSPWSELNPQNYESSRHFASAVRSTLLPIYAPFREVPHLPYEVPEFKANNDGPLLYVSFGSLGAGDTALLKRIIEMLGKTRYRALVNVGDYKDEYDDIPDNVIIDSWFPQPSVIPQVDAVIHHGGNNSFTECLYFGKPAIIMPYVWDGHDNAMRVQETGYGFRSDRYDWTDEELIGNIETCLTDAAMHERLEKISRHMQACEGPVKAAKLLVGLAK